MGLDWCVTDKTIVGCEDKLKWAEAQMQKASSDYNSAWSAYVKDNDLPEACLHVFPNDQQEEFNETAEATRIKERINRWKSEGSAYVIAPEETLGAPKIGDSVDADNWAKAQFDTLSSGDDNRAEKFRKKFPDVASWMKEVEGSYVTELTPKENLGGIGKITGIFVGQESFRGKQLNFVPWLEEHEDELCWYSNKTPDELIDMGQVLQGILEKRIDSSDPVDNEELGHRETVEAAATWCIFWGSRGHGMYAWY